MLVLRSAVSPKGMSVELVQKGLHALVGHRAQHQDTKKRGNLTLQPLGWEAVFCGLWDYSDS